MKTGQDQHRLQGRFALCKAWGGRGLLGVAAMTELAQRPQHLAMVFVLTLGVSLLLVKISDLGSRLSVSAKPLNTTHDGYHVNAVLST